MKRIMLALVAAVLIGGFAATADAYPYVYRPYYGYRAYYPPVYRPWRTYRYGYVPYGYGYVAPYAVGYGVGAAVAYPYYSGYAGYYGRPYGPYGYPVWGY